MADFATSWLCGGKAIDISSPIIVGILNVTPDSFSDGGLYTKPTLAVDHAHEMVDAGAAIIDVGGESTRPGAASVPTDEELRRVIPVVKELSAEGIIVSIDTRHAQVAKAAVEAGASIINDVSGFRDPEMVRVAAGCNAGLIVMHMLGDPTTMQAETPVYDDVVIEVKAYLLEQASMLRDFGIAKERICIDPGPGFGKTPAHNMTLLLHADELASTGYPVMVATSRKRFVGTYYGVDQPDERIWESVATALMGVEGGAQIVRVHDVPETYSALQWLKRKPSRAYVAIGTNMGDRLDTLHKAIFELDTMPYTWVTGVSSIYETEPAYYEDQDTFANAVVRIETQLHPQVLLAEAHRLEIGAGRVKTFRMGPRSLDVDLVDYAGTTWRTDDLIMPHPRVLERDFVVTPLLELDPDCVLADGRKVVKDGVKYGKCTSILEGARTARRAAFGS